MTTLFNHERKNLYLHYGDTVYAFPVETPTTVPDEVAKYFEAQAKKDGWKLDRHAARGPDTAELAALRELAKQAPLVPVALLANELGALTRGTLLAIAAAVGLPPLYTDLTPKKTIIEDIQKTFSPQGRSEVDRRAHTAEVVGSIPTPATSLNTDATASPAAITASLTQASV